MTVRVYRSSDASAPTLSGTAGALIGVLDACLVNGYGSKTAAGWTKAYSGTNLAAYKQGTGSNGFYLRVDDTGTTSARVVGYETMSDVNTGTGPFPYESQFAGGGYFIKSDSASVASRNWVIVATEKLFYFYVIAPNASISYNACMHVFGDIQSYRTGDTYNTFICFSINASYSGCQYGGIRSDDTAMTGHYLARSHHQLGGSVAAGKLSGTPITNTTMGTGYIPYPEPVSGGAILVPVVISENPSITAAYGVARGILPGAWTMAHNLPFEHGDTFSGTGSLTGKTFECFKGYTSGNSQFILETSDTW